MQEIVLLLTGVAGAASAVAYRRLPGRGALRRGGRGRLTGGQGGADAAGRIRSRIGALAAERDILGKAISRVHEDAGLNERQKDALLAMYQRQLAAVLAKIDRLEEASRYPDLGPVGDGLAELMDQKLSSLDERLHELSARIAAAVPAAAAAGAEAEEAAQGSRARRPGKKAGMQEKAVAASPGADAGTAGGAAEAIGAPRQEGAAAAAQQSTLDMPRQEQPATLQQAQQQQRQPEAKGPHTKPASPGMRQGVKPVEITTLTTIGGGASGRKFPEVGRPAGAGPARAQSPPSPSPSPPSQSPPSPSPPSQSPPSPQPTRPSPQPQAGAAQQPNQATKPGAGAGAAAAAAAPAAATAAAAAPVAAGAGPQHAASSSLPERLPKPRPFSVPDAEEQDLAADDPADDDLAAIVADIRSTLSKLEQAEVE